MPASPSTTEANQKDGKLVCVFCASRDSPDQIYNEAANSLGRELAKAGYGLVYGGGSCGLMGRVALSVHENNGDVLGITPHALTSIEGGTEIGRTLLVNSMHDRKSMMNDYAMAFIALPGGFGTLEELLETTTWSMLSIHSKPVIVLNTNGYYNALRDLTKNAVKAGFIHGDNSEIIVYCDTPQEAVAAITKYNTPRNRYDLNWTSSQPM
ncbi:hypothetical protein LPJ66_004908 [Kickxella alabastrina]|uniref:Uncharacterized protein n=1 Tax=Kickxella alabastrina TaxID=61397 RepID=A0ACC1ILZ9_9FUNG|nr:hypothetical protein LPJ66_004908 [Kickxella alabastrina]